MRSPMEMTRHIRGRSFMFLAFLVGSFILYLTPLLSLIRFAWGSNTYSYIPLIPLVSAYLFFECRKKTFSDSNRWHLAGGVPIAFAILLYALWASQGGRLSTPDDLALMALSFVTLLVGGLGLFYGVKAWKAAEFPILFLLFMIPIPSFILDKIVLFLQKWSAGAAYVFFGLTGVPMYRDGFLFHLPGLTIEVAKECSGIHSSISLFLVSLLAGHLMLRENWRKATLTLSIVPITIIKNAVRIVTLSLVGAYVDPRILGSVAHRRGGIPIFILALVLLGCVLWLLRRGEKKGSEQ
jgi:exosortase